MSKCQKPVRLGYVTAIWGRELLTRIVFKNIALLRESLAPEIELVISVAGSEGEKSRKLVSEFDFKYIEVSNAPLGAKWNAALIPIKGEVDGVCIFGSDDLVNLEYFNKLLKAIQGGNQLAGLSGLYFYDHPGNRLLYWQGYIPPRQNEVAGAGRFIGRKILEKLEWILWPPLLPAGLDRDARTS